MLLLDCGCKYKDILKAIDYRTSDVSGVLLTHEHGDHRESFKNLMNLGIQIYTNDETVEHLQIITGELMKGVPEKTVPGWLVHCNTVLFTAYYKG